MANNGITYNFRKVSFDTARQEVDAYLKKTKRTSVFEISQDLKIRADLVEDVLEEFVKKGKGRFLS